MTGSAQRCETFVSTWGSTPAERASWFPCDRHLVDYDDALYRAVDVDAPAPLVFRWLCQLKIAPYSYDWIDNFGLRSPRELTPGVEHLEVGQRVMIFQLVEFETNRHLTLLLRGNLLFGDVAITYRVAAVDDRRSRLVVKLLVRYTRPVVLRSIVRWIVPLGDLIMMRKQLLTLKALAEQSREHP
jgi:hypothetical protein